MSIRRLLGAVSITTLFFPIALPVFAAQPPEYTDVSLGHWAYPALKDLAQKYGLLLRYPDGSFRGLKSPTRYEMAVLVHQVLIRLKGKNVSPVDMGNMHRLKEHFKVELKDIAERLDYVEDHADLQSSLNDDVKDELSRLAAQHKLKLFGSLALRYCGMTTHILDEPGEILGNNLLGNTFQVRMGAGIRGELLDQFDYHLRVLTTDNQSYNLSWLPFGGNGIPRSPLFLDRFAIRYRLLKHKTDGSDLKLTAGKSRNFFPESELVFDEDVSLSGLDQQWVVKNLTSWWTRLELGLAEKALLIEETKMTSGLVGAKLAGQFQVTPQLSLRTGGNYLHYLGTDNLAKFNYSQGYQGAWGQRNRSQDKGFASDFQILNGFLKARYEMRPGLPLNVFADYAQNLGAKDQNKGTFLGLSIGQLKKVGDWKSSYIYKYQEQDYNLSLMVDDTTGGTDVSVHSFDVGVKVGQKTQLSSSLHIRQSLSQSDLAPLYIFYTTLRQDF